MPNSRLTGGFVLISQGYGILSGMYHNDQAPEPFPETAKKINSVARENSSDLYDGLYKTVWLEQGKHVYTDLEITIQHDGTYKLKWDASQTPHFEGIGFLRNNELVGSYWEL